jgi:hypothetical protein
MHKLYYVAMSNLYSQLNLRLGLRLTKTSPDRLALQNWIRINCERQTVLSVGVAWYTMIEPSLVDSLAWVTVDSDPNKAKFGSVSHAHITSKLCDTGISSKFSRMIINGVFGWGIDTTTETLLSLKTAKRLLADNGKLLIGVNDINRRLLPNFRNIVVQAGFLIVREWVVDPDPSSRHTFIEVEHA